jgi:uncharacterized surface protein with fasciclin (FAS1) repeats
MFCAALQRTGLTDELDGGVWTVFAPTNEAFSSSLTQENIDTLSDDTSLLREIILFHTVEGRIITKSELPCTAGENLIEMTNGRDARSLCVDRVPTWMKGAGNDCVGDDGVSTGSTGRRCPGSPALQQTDIEVCNGIVHVIDKILLFAEL